MHCTVQNYSLFFDIKGFGLFLLFNKGILDTIFPFKNHNLLKVTRQEKLVTKPNSCKYLFTLKITGVKISIIIGFECQVQF